MAEKRENTINSEATIETLLKSLSIEDEKILTAYQFLAQSNPDLLFLEERHLEPTEEQLDYYTSWHSDRYKEMADKLVGEDDWDTLVIGSGMFGGKSTLSFEILDRYKEQGYDTVVSIADIMPDNYVTARSYQGEKRKRRALKYPSEKEYLEKNIQTQKPFVVLLDEFSFFPNLEPLDDLLEYIKGHRARLLLTGLDSNYLGESLDIYLQTVENNHCRIENLKSFIPSIESKTPIGTHTIRYVKINDMWTYDMGILPLVVSKEEEFLVHYCPATFDMTFVYNFKDMPEIRDYILFPSEELEKEQEWRKGMLIGENNL
jgi:hypothetical protein